MKQRRHDGMATVDGPLWAWGNNVWGQLGDGSKESRTTPVETDLPEDLVAIEAATNTVHAIRSDGTVLAWGHNPFGQLGDGTTTASAFPVTVKNLRGVTSIAAGDFVLAVKSDGTVWAWGRNDGYQLGNGTTTSATTPVKVPGLRNVTAVAVGIATGYALQSDGSVWAWGDNGYGQCGGLALGDKYPEPVQVSSPQGQGQVVGRDGPVVHRSLGDITAICAGAYAGYALHRDGTVWSWGANEIGQLGNGELRTDLMVSLAQLTRHDEPGKVRNLDGVVSLASKGNSAYALKSDGTVWSWGDNRHGALGIQRTVQEWVGVGLSPSEAHHVAEATPGGAVAPLEVAGLSDVHAIAANGDSAYALKSDGTLWAWGENQFGELGDGSMQDRARPVQVVGLPRTTAIAAGITSAYAVALGTTGYDYGRRTPSGGTSVGAGTDTSFEGYVDRRLSQQPRPTRGDPKSPRYWVGAGEVMLDILLAATSPSKSDMVLNKIHQDMARGDSAARVANRLLELWATKKATGFTTSLSESVTDELAPAMVRAYRALTLLYAGAADADRVATIDAVLSRRMTPLMSERWPGLAGGDALASVLKVMLDAAVKDLA